jgi:hypothetical protein
MRAETMYHIRKVDLTWCRRRKADGFRQTELVCREWARGADDLTAAALLEMAENYRAAVLHSHDAQ